MCVSERERNIFSSHVTHPQLHSFFPPHRRFLRLHPLAPLHPPAHLARILGSTRAGSFLLAQASVGRARESGRSPRRLAGRAWVRRKELKFLFLNEG